MLRQNFQGFIEPDYASFCFVQSVFLGGKNIFFKMSRPEPAGLGFRIPAEFIEPESAIFTLEDIDTPVALKSFD